MSTSQILCWPLTVHRFQFQLIIASAALARSGSLLLHWIFTASFSTKSQRLPRAPHHLDVPVHASRCQTPLLPIIRALESLHSCFAIKWCSMLQCSLLPTSGREQNSTLISAAKTRECRSPPPYLGLNWLWSFVQNQCQNFISLEGAGWMQICHDRVKTMLQISIFESNNYNLL